MLKEWLLLLPFLLLLMNHISCHKNGTSSKISPNKKQDTNENLKEKRMKRSISSETEKILLPLNSKFIDSELEEKENQIKSDLDQPFWGMRGRRESSEEDYADVYAQKNCKNCYKSLLTNTGGSKETLSPFWGNRGRRSSEEIDDNTIPDNPFWGNRGKRQEDEPFWGTKGRREQDLPFWGNRGRRGDVKVNKNNFLTGMIMNRDDIEPFWGNRGRRKAGKLTANDVFIDDDEPFWGNRGRRDTMEPFWGSRGRRKNQNSSNINKQRGLFLERQVPNTQLRDYTLKTTNNVENNMAHSRLRRNDDGKEYSNQAHERKLLHLLTGIIENKLESKANMDTSDFGLHFKPTEPETILDDRIYANQPRYILVERSSRSSGEDDPFFITRGKKFSKFESPRGRRGVIEELVKSVRNDPYYIARGKKTANEIKIGNVTISKNDFDKASELICSTIDLLSKRDKNNKVKRDINENDRDRRTILKKLAAQLQDDPYFVSRGKKNDKPIDNENLEDLINKMASKCD